MNNEELFQTSGVDSLGSACIVTYAFDHDNNSLKIISRPSYCKYYDAINIAKNEIAKMLAENIAYEDAPEKEVLYHTSKGDYILRLERTNENFGVTKE